MRYLVLGPLQVRDGGPVPLGGLRQRLVLGVLLSRANQDLTTDWLVDAVWGDAAPRTARKTLQAYVARLRHALGPELESTEAGYRLRVADRDLDAAVFEQQATLGHRLLADDPASAATQLRAALGLWRGLPFGELGERPVLVPEVERLRERRLEALADRVDADLACGRGPGLVGELEGLVAEHPTRERFRGQLMLGLYRAGRPADAEAAYQAARRSLAEQLGLDPCVDLVRLHERIVRQDPSLGPIVAEASAPEPTAARNPYKGLRPFAQADSGDFFGRGDLIEAILDRLNATSLVTVVGASGSGKSSVVLAGVVPRLDSTLEGRPWVVATMTPGRHPFQAMRAAIGDATTADAVDLDLRGDDLDLVRVAAHVADEDCRLLLVVDQLEELLHQASPDESDRFLRNLTEAALDPAAQVTVLTTLRADYLDRMLEACPDGGVLTGGLVPVVPLTPTELAEASVEPAAAVGACLEPELLTELVADVADQPGALPLFQYALTEVFDGRSSYVLTRAVYQDLGGLRGAVARRADELFAAFEVSQRAAARQVFLRLATVAPDAEPTRRRARLSELESLGLDPGDLHTVLDVFDTARLLTFDRSPERGEPTVEVAHEALLREWPRLRMWLETAADDLALHRALAAEVSEWEDSGRDPDFLITGSRLDLYEAWPTPGALEPTGPEQEFLHHSRVRRDVQAASRRTAARRLRMLLVVACIAALISTGLAVFAVERGQATAASERESRSRELANAAAAAVETDPELAILLALESIDVTRSQGEAALREAETALHNAVNAHRVMSTARGEWSAAFTPDGLLLVGGASPALIDAETGEIVHPLDPLPDGSEAKSVAVSPDGRLLATGTDGRGRIHLYDSDGVLVRELSSPRYGTAHGEAVTAMAFSPDSTLLASVSPRSAGLTVWDTATGEYLFSDGRAQLPPDLCCPAVTPVFSPDGSRLAVTVGNEIRILALTTREWRPPMVDEEQPATPDPRLGLLTGLEVVDESSPAMSSPPLGLPSAPTVAFLPDGTTLVRVSSDGTITFWDVEGGEVVSSTDAGSGPLWAVALSPDGSRLLTGGQTGDVLLWEVDGPRVLNPVALSALRSAVMSISFDTSGEMAAAVGFDESVVVWDVTPSGRGEVATWPAAGPAVFGPEGAQIASVAAPGTDVVLMSTADWQAQRTITDVGGTFENPAPESEGRGLVTELAFEPKGAFLATAVTDTPESREVAPYREVALWDPATGARLADLGWYYYPAGPMDVSDDGSLLSISTRAATPVRVWNTRTETVDMMPELPEPGRIGLTAALSPDGALVAVQSSMEVEPNVQLWSVEPTEKIAETVHRAFLRGAVDFSPDGASLVTGGADGVVRLWQTPGLEPVLAMEGHTGPIQDAKFTEDGARVATSSEDGTVRLWDAEAGELQVTLVGHQGFADIDISPDGRYLVSADGTTARVWALDLDELVRIAESRLTRSLTEAECVSYHVETCPTQGGPD